MMKYALYRGAATNIGEEIQSIAAQRFLPTVDYYIIKEKMNSFQSQEKTKLIMNAYYMINPQNFPPQDCVDPLLISMYFNMHCRNTILSKQESIDFFKKYGPVGCRDMSTKKWLDENNIPAYFSGCLTSTLIPNEKLRVKYPDKYILCVDCYNEIIDYVRKNADYPVLAISKEISPCILSMDRYKVAKAFLFLYQNAHCVITTNLHTAIPCLAFNTRVCVIELELPPDSRDLGRFEGMEDFFNWETKESFVTGAYDFNNPIENPKAFEKYRDALVYKCREFTGFDANKPTLDDAFNPFHTVISSISTAAIQQNGFIDNRKRIRRALYFAKSEDLLKMYELKTTKDVNYHDLPNDQDL